MNPKQSGMISIRTRESGLINLTKTIILVSRFDDFTSIYYAISRVGQSEQ